MRITLDMMRDVIEFNRKIGQPVAPRRGEPRHLSQRLLIQRRQLLAEELEEFERACDAQDLEEQADALVDLVYVALGTAALLGLPWRALWDDVHRANMAKVPGRTRRGHATDAAKPEGWVPPQTARVLAEHGYRRDDYLLPGTYSINEHKCVGG